jgi:hypothetical protein
MPLSGRLIRPLQHYGLGLPGNGVAPGGGVVGPFIVGTSGGTPSQGTTTNTPTYTGARAGSMLYIAVTANMATPAAFTITGNTTGWSASIQVTNAASTLEVELWSKVATGNDGMPTFNATAGTVMYAEVAEVANLSSNAIDQTGSAIGTASPLTATAGGTDGGTGRIVVAVVGQRQVGSATSSNSDSFNLGTGTVTVLGDNGSLSQSHHSHSCVCIGSTTGSVADTYVWTQLTGTTNHVVTAFASYH